MSKQKKKRNKAYTGAGSAATRPTVTRISAVNRSALGQWWFDNKKRVRTAVIIASVIIFGSLIIIEIIRLFTGA